MKFSKEVIDRISSFIPTLSRDDSERRQMLLWSTIFKNDQWLTEVTEKDNARLVLIGSQLSRVSSQEKQGECKNNYMILGLLGGTGKIPTWEMFKSSLHQHTYDPSSNKVHFTSGIMLNVHILSDPFLSVLRKFEKQRQTPCLVDSDDGIRKILSLYKGKPTTQYSFYRGSCIQDLGFRNIREILLEGKGWSLALHDNGVDLPVTLTSMFYNVRDPMVVA